MAECNQCFKMSDGTIKLCYECLEAERTKYKNVLEFLVVSKANDRVKMECVKRALKGGK